MADKLFQDTQVQSTADPIFQLTAVIDTNSTPRRMLFSVLRDWIISAIPKATQSVLGISKPDGSTISIDANGTLSALGVDNRFTANPDQMYSYLDGTNVISLLINKVPTNTLLTSQFAIDQSTYNLPNAITGANIGDYVIVFGTITTTTPPTQFYVVGKYNFFTVINPQTNLPEITYQLTNLIYNSSQPIIGAGTNTNATAYLAKPYKLPIATTTTLGGVKGDGATLSLATDGTISINTAAETSRINSAVNTLLGITTSVASWFLGLFYSNSKTVFVSGTNITLTPNDTNNTITISATGGGGGGNVSASATWSSGGTSKNAIDTAGINLSLVSSSGNITAISSITVGGVALTGTFAITGTFPNFSVVVPSSQLPTAVQTNGGSVQVVGTLAGQSFSAQAGTLTTLQAQPFAVSITSAFATANVPYFNLNNNLQTAVGTITGSITAVALSYNSQSITALPSTLAITDSTVARAISGSITGNGLNGAGSGTITITSQAVAPATIYYPLFGKFSANSNDPLFATTDNPTNTNTALGSTITIPRNASPLTTDYVWIAIPASLTTITANNIYIATGFGFAQFAPTTTYLGVQVGGVSYNVYGSLTGQATNQPIQLKLQ